MPFTYSPIIFLQLFVYILKYVINPWFPEGMFHFNIQIIELIFSNWKHFLQKSGFVPYVYGNKIWIVQGWKGNLHQGWIQFLMHTCSFFPTLLIHTCSFSRHLPHSVFTNRLGVNVPNPVSHAQLWAQVLCIVFIFFSVQLPWNNFSIADALCTQSCNTVTGILEIIKSQPQFASWSIIPTYNPYKHKWQLILLVYY